MKEKKETHYYLQTFVLLGLVVMSLKGARFQLQFRTRMKLIFKIGAEKGHVFSSKSTRP